MSVTRESDVEAQTPDLWKTKLYAQAEKLTFFHRFEGGEGSNMPVIRVDDLENRPGHTIYVDIVLALTGAGLTGDTDQGLLDGNEEKLVFRQNSFVTDALRHGVRWTKLGKIRINHKMRGTALNQLKKWLAGKLDDAIFAEFSGNGVQTPILPDSYKVAAGGPATGAAASDVATTDVLDLDMVTDIKALAKVDRRIEPIATEDGEELYFLLMHDYAGADLKKSADWKQAQREARERGAGNPLFRGALGMWDNVVFLQSDRVVKADDGATSNPVARNLFLGAQALMRGYAYLPDWTEQYFSYGEEQGIGTYTVVGEKLNVFDLNATETAGDVTDDTAIGALLVYSQATTPAIT